MEQAKTAYATIAQADAVLAGWNEAGEAWFRLDNRFKSEMLVLASDHIDALPLLYPKADGQQPRNFPVRCTCEACGTDEARTACILQAAHLVMNPELLSGDIVNEREYPAGARTVCFENTADCILYSLGALLLLESFTDLSRVLVE